MVLGCFWSFSSKPLIIFGSPDVFRLRKEPINSLSSVRPSATRYLEIRASDFDDFAQSYILMSLKKCSKRIFEKNSRLAIFSQKIRFLDIFFESAHQICLKLDQKLGTIALNHQMTVLYLGKFLFWPFWPFLGQKCIACGDIIWFWAVFGHFLPNR